MSLEKSTAIVLRVVEFSETSYIVTLYTRDFGKIGAIAKGAKRPKSSFESALDLLSVCRIVFLHKSSESLDILTEAKLERRFRAGTRDLSRLYAGYYVAELLLDMTDEVDPHADLFDVAEETLRELGRAPSPLVAGAFERGEIEPGDMKPSKFAQSDGIHEVSLPRDTITEPSREFDVDTLVLRFELMALRVLGHLPSFSVCAACGGDLGGHATNHQSRRMDNRIAFGLLAGGALCQDCRSGQHRIMSISRAVLETLERFASEDEAWRRGIERAVLGELRAVMNHFLANLLGRKPKMHAWLTLGV